MEPGPLTIDYLDQHEGAFAEAVMFLRRHIEYPSGAGEVLDVVLQIVSDLFHNQGSGVALEESLDTIIFQYMVYFRQILEEQILFFPHG